MRVCSCHGRCCRSCSGYTSSTRRSISREPRQTSATSCATTSSEWIWCVGRCCYGSEICRRCALPARCPPPSSCSCSRLLCFACADPPLLFGGWLMTRCSAWQSRPPPPLASEVAQAAAAAPASWAAAAPQAARPAAPAMGKLGPINPAPAMGKLGPIKRGAPGAPIDLSGAGEPGPLPQTAARGLLPLPPSPLLPSLQHGVWSPNPARSSLQPRRWRGGRADGGGAACPGMI